MTDYDLDLDTLQPEAKKVKINGRIVDVYPPKFKSIIALMKISSSMQEVSGSENLAQVEQDLTNALIPIMPALAEPDMDLSMEQLMKLLDFVMLISTPQDNEELAKKGYTVKQLNQKKTEQSLVE